MFFREGGGLVGGSTENERPGPVVSVKGIVRCITVGLPDVVVGILRGEMSGVG
jgi:hypothetical protein